MVFGVELFRVDGGFPTFKGFPNPYGSPFPASICTSINENVVHGIPSPDVVLRDGDIISVDCGTLMNGFCGDSAYTFCVGDVSEEVKQLLKTTKEALYLGIEQAGIGKAMHEDPQVPNYGKRGSGTMLKKGMCLAIEPMITMGNRQLVMESDRWTVRTKDRSFAAHFEHTVAVGSCKADILSSFRFIEEVLGDKAI